MGIEDIVQQGEEKKYKVTINQEGFSMNDDDFRIRLSWGLNKKSLLIPKDKMFSDEHDNWYFTFPTDGMVGRVIAECVYYVPDDDFDDGLRTMVDRQFLCFVVTLPLPRIISCPPSPGPDGHVHYEAIGDSNVTEYYAYLLESNGNNLATTDGERLVVLKKHR